MYVTVEWKDNNSDESKESKSGTQHKISLKKMHSENEIHVYT